jgi:hypothetical protein
LKNEENLQEEIKKTLLNPEIEAKKEIEKK